jgi:carbonic anhydrase
MKSDFIITTFAAIVFANCSLGCSVVGVHHDKSAVPAENPKVTETAAALPKTPAIAAKDEEHPPEKAAEKLEAREEKKSEVAVVKKNDSPHDKVVSSETSLGWLKHGNVRFIKKAFRADGRSEKDRERLTKGQHPHAIILSCSDSRVPPEIVFDQTLGEIFVIRVLGEVLDSSVLASIEYAVEHLHSSLLVVMGHSQCGAVAASVKTAEGKSAGSPDLDKLISDIRPRLASLKNETPSVNLEVEATLNADGVARDLVNRSTLIKNAVDQGALVIKSALYRTDSGKVTFY